jgi:hypothetical protein
MMGLSDRFYPSCPVPWVTAPKAVLDALEYIDGIRLQLIAGREAQADVEELAAHLATLRGYVRGVSLAGSIELAVG